MPVLAAPTAPADAQPRIGLALGSALYVASVLGTGILLLPTLAARAAGPASLVAVAAVLLASVPLAATFAALATRHPDSGGVATYVRLALGSTAARMTGYWFFFGVCVGSPVVALLGCAVRRRDARRHAVAGVRRGRRVPRAAAGHERGRAAPGRAPSSWR